jgi:hypothetical protein
MAGWPDSLDEAKAAFPLVALALVVLFLWLTILLVRHWLQGARLGEDTRRSKQ